jgi:hypothetical protein
MAKPLCITFAGVPGSSKSIVAHYISERFGLPILSSDNLRFEVKEDLLVDNINLPHALEEFEGRKEARLAWLLARHRSFILDGSVDRTWQDLKKRLETAGYAWFIVDMELSADFLTNLYQKTGRDWAVEELPRYMNQHQIFMAEHAGDVGVQITDETFVQRTSTAEAALRAFIDDKSLELR